jgi:hypothetical protein
MEERTDPTLSRETVSQGLHGVREAARRDEGMHPYPLARFYAKHPR